MMTMTRIVEVFFLLAIFSGFSANGVAAPATQMLDFDSPQQRALYLKLIEEFRCLKCQNQNLAGSAADLADDLKREIHQMVLAGRNQAQITEFLVARYGDFVLYRPPFKLTTALLWLGPFMLLAVGVVVVFRFSRPADGGLKTATDVEPLAGARELARAKSLLED